MLRIKKTITAGIAFALSAVLAVSAAAATIQALDDDTTPTYGIVQVEEEWNSGHTQLVKFKQEKMLYPYVGTIGNLVKPTEYSRTAPHPVEAYQWIDANNVVDKYVSVKNIGNTQLYVRTLFAFEMGDLTEDEFSENIGISKNETINSSSVWKWENNLVGENDRVASHLVVEINGERYWVIEARHLQALAGGASTVPSLRQVYLNYSATNEIVEKLDGNKDGKYTILASSEFIQVANGVVFANINAAKAKDLFENVLKSKNNTTE